MPGEKIPESLRRGALDRLCPAPFADHLKLHANQTKHKYGVNCCFPARRLSMLLRPMPMPAHGLDTHDQPLWQVAVVVPLAERARPRGWPWTLRKKASARRLARTEDLTLLALSIKTAGSSRRELSCIVRSCGFPRHAFDGFNHFRIPSLIFGLTPHGLHDKDSFGIAHRPFRGVLSDA